MGERMNLTGVNRTFLAALLAAVAGLALPGFGGIGESEASGLALEASPGGCDGTGSAMVCEIDVAFGGVAGADYYTASITRPDGSVEEAGTVGSGEGGGSATIHVSNVSAGTYTVTVSAWGDAGSGPTRLDRAQAGG
jgi:hypothetical protein